jgi:hypothetical protein
MGNMRHSTARRKAEEHQEDFVFLVNEEIDKGNITIGKLAALVDMDRSVLSRVLSLKRRLSYMEVIKISQCMGIRPEVWNTIGNPPAESRFLPLYGNVAASVWRVKGEKMPETLSPIRPIDIGDDETREQFCYFVKEGPYAGEYAVCIHVDEGYVLEDGDMVVVEETRMLPPMGVELCNTTLKVAQITEDRALLVSLADETGADGIPYPSGGYELKGLVIGIFRPTRKKKA